MSLGQNTYHDSNHVPVLAAVSSSDGESVVLLWADPVTHRLLVTSSGGPTWYQDEIVATGQTGTSFTLAHTPTAIVFLFKNGQYLVSGGVSYDYTLSGASITLNVALLSTDLLTANYS